MAKARNLVLLSLSIAMNGCATTGTANLPAACIGTPSDPTNPSTGTAKPSPTHGPGTDNTPVRLAASGGWPVKQFSPPPSIAMLYAYDDAGGYALHPMRKNDTLNQPIYRDLANQAFWGEVVDGRYYQVPWFGSCDQTRLLGNDFAFVAPRDGILFVQYRMDHCAECDEVTRAVEKTITDHPSLPIRWVQYDLDSVRADWCQSKFNFITRRDDGKVGKEYTCRK